MAILICGGAGYIGSNINKMLSQQGYQTVVFDNLIYGHRELVKWGEFVQGDLNDYSAIDAVFKRWKIDAVFHFAAYAYVGESVKDPAKYYRNNVTCTLNLLGAMRANGCNRIIFSSTCATYGVPPQVPITEDMPQNPINPYGATKLMVERIFKDYAAAYGLQFVVLRYFNAAGADPDGEIGEWHIPETHLIPLVLDAAAGRQSNIKVLGTDYPTRDGTCIRDYIHVYDLADAHLRALRYLQKEGKSDFFNLGNAQGTSVLEVIDAVKKITNSNFLVEYCSRRVGDPAELVGDSKKARSVLGWEPRHSKIENIVGDAWQWYQKLSEKERFD